MKSMDEIIKTQKAEFDVLLTGTKARLERVEGPNCNRYPPEFNVFNHPYWAGVELRMLGNSLFGLF
jgi:hypothetical protein